MRTVGARGGAELRWALSYLPLVHGDGSASCPGEACTQGCPAGSLCFAAALQDSLETVATEFFSDCLLLAIHDDVFVCGPPARAAPAAALRRLLTLATQSCGLTPSGHKFTAYCASEVPEYTANQLHQELDAWTPAEQLHQGRQC